MWGENENLETFSFYFEGIFLVNSLILFNATKKLENCSGISGNSWNHWKHSLNNLVLEKRKHIPSFNDSNASNLKFLRE